MVLPRVSIVILNWNGWEDTIECLESLFQIHYPNYDVIVVDNASEDASVEKIKEYANGMQLLKSEFFDYNPFNKPLKITEYPNKESEFLKRNNKNINKFVSTGNLTLVNNDDNYGYAKGNNIGIKYAFKHMNPDYVLILNNDTVMDKNFLIGLVKYAETSPDIGIIGPKIYYYDFPSTIQVASIKINFWRGTSYLIGDGEIDVGQYDEISKTDSVPGSCFLVKREVIDKVGLLNPEYKCYWEESDYCMRAKKMGYECIYYPHSRIWHKVSKSTNKVKGILTYYMTRNMFWFMKSHADRTHKIVFILFFFGLKLWVGTVNLLYNKRNEDIPFFFKGIKDGIK